MKGSHKILLALLFVGMLLGNGCKPKDCHEDGTCAEDYRRMPLGEAKEYLTALPGSYWVYKNTVTGDIDSQVCIGFICDTIIGRGTENFSRHITIEYERIVRDIQCSFNNRFITDETAGYNPDAPRSIEAIADRHSNHSIKVFFYPFVSGRVIGNGASYTSCRGIDTTLIIQGKTYTNVAVFELDLDGIWENSPPYTGSKYYWAKGVGLLKREATNKKDNWELIRYHIIK